MPDALVFAALRPKLRGAPIVLNFHDTFPELFATLFDRPPGHPLVRLIRAEERLSAALADGHVFVTAEARDLLRARGVAAERTQIVMNTPDERVFGERRTAVRSRLRAGSCASSTTAASPNASGSRRWCGRWRCCGTRGEPVALDVYGSDAEAAAQLAAVAARDRPARRPDRAAADAGGGDPEPARGSRTSASFRPCATTSPSCCCRSSCSSTSTWGCRSSPRGCR